MKIYTATKYYLESISTMIYGFKDFLSLIFVCVQGTGKVKLNTGHDFYIEKRMDIWALKEVILDDCYNVKNKTGTVEIDIGAGIGDLSIVTAQKFKKIYSYEIKRETFDIFEKNIKLNKIKNITNFQKKVISLDNVFKENKILNCDFLKIDCEGDEYPIFNKTPDKTLKKIKDIAFEVHLFNERQKSEYIRLKKRLTKLGFRITEKENPVHEYLSFLFAER